MEILTRVVNVQFGLPVLLFWTLYKGWLALDQACVLPGKPQYTEGSYIPANYTNKYLWIILQTLCLDVKKNSVSTSALLKGEHWTSICKAPQIAICKYGVSSAFAKHLQQCKHASTIKHLFCELSNIHILVQVTSSDKHYFFENLTL